MAFQGYVNALTDSPLAVSAGGQLNLPDVQAVPTNIIQLEWPFISPSPDLSGDIWIYPFSQVLFSSSANQGIGTLKIQLPNIIYASYPQSVLIINQSVTNILDITDVNGTFIAQIYPPSNLQGTNNYLITLTSNSTTNQSVAWTAIPLGGTLPPFPSVNLAGLGLVSDSIFSNTGQAPLFNPMVQTITAVNQFLSLSPYAYNFPAQQLTIEIQPISIQKEKDGKFSITLTISGILADGTFSQTQTLLFDQDNIKKNTGTTNYTFISSIQVTKLTFTDTTSVGFTSLISDSKDIPAPLDTTQPIFILTENSTTLYYQNRNQIILVPSSVSEPYLVALPDLITSISPLPSPIPYDLANGYCLGFVNQSLQSLNFSVTSAGQQTVTINNSPLPYILPPNSSVYLIYRYKFNPSVGPSQTTGGDWIVMGLPGLPLSTSQGGLGQSFSSLSVGSLLYVNSSQQFALLTPPPNSTGTFTLKSTSGTIGWV